MPATTSKDLRHWFITGASGGLGRQLTEHALHHGEHVTATVRRAGALDDLRAAHPGRLTVELLDLARPAEVQEVLSRIARTDPVDVVVNNAGYAVVGAAEEMTVEQIRDQVEVLLLAPMLITRAFLAPMRERGSGRIVQISSMGGQLGIPTHSSYHAGKWGLEGFTESVAREVAEFGVHLTLVELGGTRTGFGSALRYTEETTAYRDTTVGRMRRQLETADDSVFTGDPAKVVAAIRDTVLDPDPPLRITLGADSYSAVHNALSERLSALEAQKELAESVAFTH
ncbi:SDR family oxidoreductase [Amycolatopsis ultiminotia]|uniref:SDR family oxidoreductase n=1 Tax=Amycolatopsis ultiminotia TaxID=543629 RepID=A0ABP6Y3X5_9PSEU